MKYYGVDMIGNFKCQRYATLTNAGSASSSDEGRIIYIVDEENLYMNEGEQWVRISKHDFITLTDCPSSYNMDPVSAGNYANNLVIVNAGASGTTFIEISASLMIENLSGGITEATSGAMNSLIVLPASASLVDQIAALSASTIVRAVTGGMEDRRIPVWNGTERDLVTAHTSAYINPSGDIYAKHVYNAVWNDIADFIEVDCSIEYGYVYIMDENYKVRKSRNYMEPGIIGIASDTYGFGLGNKNGKPGLMPISIGGFVLAHIDDIYLSGTPLTCSIDGTLTKIEQDDKINFPERIVATFFKPEYEKTWNGIEVNNRHWVKVK